MAKRIYISPSNQSANTYATGNTNEKEQCHKIAKACFDYLKANGFDVKCTYNNDMYARVKESNLFKSDVHIAIHTNATGKHNVTGGSQVLLYNLLGERKKIGEAVLKRLAPLTPGESAERLVEKPDFYEINSANAITVYCECEFHDTKEGSDFIRKNTKKIGEAIARGICDYYGVKPKATTTTTKKEEEQKIYRVQVGAYSKKANAEKTVEKLKKAGFEAVIV